MSLTIDKFIAAENLGNNREFIYHSYSINYLDSFQVSLKRLLDLFISFVFLVFIGWWLFAIISICIAIESKGPIIFKQLRHGKNNRPFYCYKFRSMKYNSNWKFLQAHKGDPRITKVGAFIRSTSIDELPQIFNVLIGEMSLVGPRPHALTMNREYSEKITKFMSRHIVKPGITGLAQASGLRGEIRDQLGINHRLTYDLFYIKKWSILLDLKIMFMTIKCLLTNNKNAY